MAGSGSVAAFLAATLMLSYVSANTLWMPVQVVDCDNKPVVGVKVSLWGCNDMYEADAQGVLRGVLSTSAATPQTSTVIASTGSSGYIASSASMPAGSCAGLPTEFCWGSAKKACKITVLKPDLTTDPAYTTQVVFDNYTNGVQEYVVTWVPQCKAKSFGDTEKCNNCGSDQYCYVVTTVMRPSCCPKKMCYCT